MFVAYMFWSQRSVLSQLCSAELDIRLRTAYQRAVAQARAVDGPYMREKLHQLAEYSERKALAIVARLLSRFGKVRDVVTGKDLPKNKGSVSFFLNHIANHKSKLGAYNQEAGEGKGRKTLDDRMQKKLEINRK